MTIIGSGTLPHVHCDKLTSIGFPRPGAVDLEDFCALRVHRVLNVRHLVCRNCPFPTAGVCIFDDGPTIAKYCFYFA